mmetsp:Transcript_64637/g.119155  ORF Transcript_64637/g.119155 Transcript_64637/m.119155 type:complete len:89 (+) Transcript_64637:826-1092(+)
MEQTSLNKDVCWGFFFISDSASSLIPRGGSFRNMIKNATSIPGLPQNRKAFLHPKADPSNAPAPNPRAPPKGDARPNTVNTTLRSLAG